jgi:16S rRNA C967 or C1407 C5-methylase (RsmB/RsmF family)
VETRDLPKEFRLRMQQQLGDEADAFFHALDLPAPVSIRLHPKKGKSDFDFTGQVPWCENGYYLNERPSFHLDPHWHGGAYYVQEASSMIIDAVVKQLTLPSDSRIWLDLCAAPGGKTGILAKHLGASDVLIANEVVPQRKSVLYENLVKGGYLNTFISGEKTSHFPADFADVILIDAPCAGEGMMRKEPEAIQQWSPGLVRSCSVLQKEIVSDAVKILKPGGWLIYSTCSYSPDENIDNVQSFLQRHPLAMKTLQFDPAWKVTELQNGKAVGYQLFPHQRQRGRIIYHCSPKNNITRKSLFFFQKTK